ncbi:hypothetical protein [Gordonia namibiensis]|nr:hypothetical protein [Gordonia namibiensis]
MSSQSGGTAESASDVGNQVVPAVVGDAAAKPVRGAVPTHLAVT